MSIYILAYILDIVLGFLLLNGRNMCNKNNKKLYLIITTLFFGLIAGFRSVSVGYDTASYQDIFNRIPASIYDALNVDFREEIGFVLLISLIKSLGWNFQALLIITSVFIMGACCIFIYRHSTNVLLSVFIILSFPFYYSSFDIIRHFLATSFILLGYKYILKKNFIKYLLFIFLGFLFHKVAIVFIPLYFIDRFKFSILSIGLILFVSFILFVYLDDLVKILILVMGKSDEYLNSMWFGTDAGGNITAVMYLVIFIISCIAFNNIKKRSINDRLAVAYTFILFVCSLIFINARIIIRIMMSMIPFLSISIPQLLCDVQRMYLKSNRNILLAFFIVIGVAYHFFMLITHWQNVVPYIPFWK